jgi:hypothetical protein
MSITQINDIITGFDKSTRSPYTLFAFVDENKSEYNSSISFEDEILKMFENTSPYILSEDSSSCNITNTDRNNYQTKLSELTKLINDCKKLNLSQEKQDECIYNKLLSDSTKTIILSLIEILKKINSECLTKKIVGEESVIKMCGATDLFNGFSSSDIDKNIEFIKKYSTVMVELKNIADNNIKNYMNKCRKDPTIIQKYEMFQDLLSKALFEAKICKPPEQPVYSKEKCLEVPEINNQIYNLQTEKQDLENEITILKSKNDMILQEYTEKENSSDFVWNATFSFRNGWIYWGIIIFLIILLCVIGYFGFVRNNTMQSYGMSAYRPM